MSDFTFVGYGDSPTWRVALDVLLPVLLGGISHVVVIKRNFWPALAALPIDGGLSWRARRLFGANKTVRGLLVMPGATAACNVLWALATGATAQPWNHSARASEPASLAMAALWGGLLGLGYVLGELPNSAIKRQLDIDPGMPAQGILGRLFWAIDQMDSLVGVAVVAALLAPLPWAVFLLLACLTLVVHPTVAFVMVKLGLKQRVG